MNYTVNLTELTNKLADNEKYIKAKLTEKYDSFEYYLSVYAILNNIYPTYLAPAYHFEKYCELHDNPYCWGIFNKNIEEKKAHSFLRIEFQDTILSIKALLDRIVQLVAVKYKGVSRDSTFGRYDKETNKGKGLMTFAYHMANRDEYMAFLVSEYESWISKAVMPRDKIVHYNDLPIIYKTTFDPDLYIGFDSAPTIVHLNKNLREGIDIANTKQVEEIAYDKENITEYIQRLYKLFDFTVEIIKRK
jgi:hypothetical protein